MSKIQSKYINSDSNWYRGNYDNEYKFEAKVFQEPSHYGINDGQVSKLLIQNLEGDWLVNYDRGWDVKPEEENLEMFNQIVSHLESRPLAPYEDDLERMKNAVIPFRT